MGDRTQQRSPRKDPLAENAKKIAIGLVKKKILIASIPTVAVIVVVALVAFLLVVLVGVLAGLKGANDMVFENGSCVDVGTATPRVVASAGTGGATPSTGGATAGQGPLGMPVDEAQSDISSGFGPRWGTLHDGVDFVGVAGAETYGAPIYSVADGVVTAAGPADGYGNWIRIMHNVDGEQVESLYGHMEDGNVFVSTGDTVKGGQHIGNIGNAGTSTGAHLHFGVYPGGWGIGGGVDPVPWLNSGKFAAATSAADATDDSTVSTNAASINAGDMGQIALAADVITTAQSGGGTVTAADWEKLAQCESGGNWAIDTGNGFSGGLQFTDQTWAAFGGTEFAPKASQAGREEQMEVANRVLREQGWGAWPACTQKLSELQSLQPAPEGTFLQVPNTSGTSTGAGQSLPGFDGGNEQGLQVESVRILRNVHNQFPEITTIGGWRPNDPYPDHPSGRAVDVMIDNYSTPEGAAVGDAVARFLQENAAEFGIEYMIWKQASWYQGNPLDQWQPMEDRGSDTQNHYDHVHVTVTDGGGYPTDATVYASVGGARSVGTSTTTGGTSTAAAAANSATAKSDLPGLAPYTATTEQLSMQLNVEQQSNVKGIISSVKESRLPEEQQPRAAVLAAMLAGQQSNFVSLSGLDDPNRVGIFAEAPRRSKPRSRLLDPKIVSGDFYRALKETYGDDDSWLTKPAADVLVEVYPERKSLQVELAKWESISTDSVAILWNTRGAQKGATLPSVFEDIEPCAVGAHPRSGTASPGAALDVGSVPAEYVKWLEIGAMECEAMTAPVLAAQSYHEGGFQAHEYRDVGGGQMVGGRTQFLAETWAAYGYAVDDQGQPTGPAGGGDPNSVADATMAQARYNCANADIIQGWIDDGSVTGDITALTLGAYLAGPGAIQGAGGIGAGVADINGSTPKSYSDTILALAESYTDLGASVNVSGGVSGGEDKDADTSAGSDVDVDVDVGESE
ncbi:transglycosylase family protein [Corynebacterium crudilactis]|uniref:Peptidase M23 n=1 Tax=Corynebacterium crudilactis TaxID=1652495 RepID=A0A172QXV5_9CORY|nr:transglycosylase family protein [Corynebacterium crudilactis]ANE05542.1 hypothetical protein ccrud_14475 [Corynebacterium crudilactis]